MKKYINKLKKSIVYVERTPYYLDHVLDILDSSLVSLLSSSFVRLSSFLFRFVRLGTASMLTQTDGPFINLARWQPTPQLFSLQSSHIPFSLPRLNIGKYSGKPGVAKALFEYIFHHENSIREAMELAAQAVTATK